MRKLFVCFCVCVVLLWSALYLRFGFENVPKLLPDLLANVDRIRSDRVCAPLATILVNSAPWHSSLRQVIRATWGHPSVLRPLGLGLVFGVGMGQPLQLEAAACGDLLQYPGEDDYRSLPQKVSWLLGKVQRACDRPFVVKVDDDVFVNVHALQKVLLDLASESSSKTLWCLVWEGMPVIRANHSKWYVSRDSYSESLYPTYCSGAAYIMSASALQGILDQENASRLTTDIKLLPQKETSQTPSVEYANLDGASESNTHSRKKPKDGAHYLVTSEYGELDGMSNDYEHSQDPSDKNRPLDISSQVNERPLVTSLKTKDRPVVTSEDIYITGLLAGKAGITHVQMGTKYAFESIEKDRISDGRTVFAHLGPEAEERLEELWDWVEKYRTKEKGNTPEEGL